MRFYVARLTNQPLTQTHVQMNRAPLSSIFSLLAGATLIVFVVSIYRNAPPQHWTFLLILGWAVMLAAG
jgi:hypothetical protein